MGNCAGKARAGVRPRRVVLIFALETQGVYIIAEVHRLGCRSFSGSHTRSSAVEHRLDMAGVTGSIPVVCTILIQTHDVNVMRIAVNNAVSIDEGELGFSFIRAGGPGGQNVNKVATAVQLRFDAQLAVAAASRPGKLERLAGGRLTKDGEIVITANRFRTRKPIARTRWSGSWSRSGKRPSCRSAAFRPGPASARSGGGCRRKRNAGASSACAPPKSTRRTERCRARDSQAP